MAEFYNKYGSLTLWALQRGYQEQHNQDGICTRMYMEHGTIFVSQYDHQKHARLYLGTYHTIAEARDSYRRRVRMVKDGQL